jgi:hypothetical protein
MERERSVITMRLLQHSYQISSLGNCAMTLPTETDLSIANIAE